MLGRLKTRALRAFMSPEQRAEEAARRLGLSIDPPLATHQADKAAYHEAKAQFDRGGFKALEQLYMAEHASKRRLLSARRAYAVLDGIADDLVSSEMDPREAEHRLHEYRWMWERSGKGPFASAMLGRMLFNTGFAHRGSDWAANVSDDDWEKLAEYTEQAHELFLESASAAESCPYWHRALLSIGISDGSSPEQLSKRFACARAFDPCDLDVYTTRAWQLLPRWHGSYEEIEELARDAVAVTRHALGAALYARIYMSLSDVEHLPDTAADWELMRKGFDDLMGIVRSQGVINGYAGAAFLFGDWETFTWLAHEQLAEYHPEIWPSPELAAEALESLLD